MTSLLSCCTAIIPLPTILTMITHSSIDIIEMVMETTVLIQGKYSCVLCPEKKLVGDVLAFVDSSLMDFGMRTLDLL